MSNTVSKRAKKQAKLISMIRAASVLPKYFFSKMELDGHDVWVVVRHKDSHKLDEEILVGIPVDNEHLDVKSAEEWIRYYR